MNFSNDDFIRTTEERHKKSVQALWKKLEDAGDIYLGKYSGWYAVRDEAYYAEDELTGGSNSSKIAPSGAECEWVEEESYFFRLSAWGERLLELYESNPEFVLPRSRLNEVASFVRSGLRDLSISRTNFNWGVPVPGNEKHVMYVWIDALTNYITALGYPDTESADFQTFWPADLHVVGKDILRFHAVYWPAFLMSAGIEPPKRVFAHGWWTIEGQKMSKSLGNVIAPQDLIDRYGVDASRYFMLREVPFGNDGDFSHEQAVHRINSDLANGIGNLAQRTLSMIYKNCDGKLPEYSNLQGDDKALLELAQVRLLPTVRGEFDQQRLHKAIEEIWKVVGEANAYIDRQAPWVLRKKDPKRMEEVLYVLAEAIRCIVLTIQPIMPDSTAKLLDQLGVPENERGFEYLGSEHSLKPGTPINKPEGVFPRIEG
jgi:methionyl-tRNA synthetase